MARRTAEDTAINHVAVPDYLKAGGCVEVWAPELGGLPTAAYSRYRCAKREFMAATGLALLPYQSRPVELRDSGYRALWSFTAMSEDPDRLAAHLAWLGLPPDWQPKSRLQKLPTSTDHRPLAVA